MSDRSQHIEPIALESAARWRARLDSDEADEGDWLAYEEWLSAAPEHPTAAAALDEVIVDIEAHGAAIIATSGTVDVIRGPTRWFARPAVWAASAAAAAAAALMLLITPPSSDFTYAAPPGQVRIVDLPDGTRVHLNRSAILHGRFGQDRRVELVQGEASFDVHHDAARPFEVAAAGARIRDIGTEFNVARNAQSLVVTVRSGQVELTEAAASSRIVAGQAARVSSGSITLASAHADDAFAWQSGHLVYHETPLSVVLEDFNRYSAKPIVLANESAANLHFSGILAIGEPHAMLAHLQEFLPIRVNDDGRRIIVGSSA